MLYRLQALEAILSAYPHIHLNQELARSIEGVGQTSSNVNPAQWLDPIMVGNPIDPQPMYPGTLFMPSTPNIAFYQMRLPIQPTFEGELRREEPHALANASLTIIDCLHQRFGKRLPALYLGFIYFAPMPDNSTELVYYVAEKGLD